MLVLTRKSGESLIIGDDVVVTIVEIRGNQVKIGVEAPDSIKVYREELLKKIMKENVKAAKTNGSKISALVNQFKVKK
jgi:carbon storage regulator